MIIVGAGSAGRETLGIYLKTDAKRNVCFYDDADNIALNGLMKIKLINRMAHLVDEIKNDPQFCVAIGNGRKRKRLFDKMTALGAIPVNVIAHSAVTLSEISDNGSIIQPGVVISYCVEVGRSCMIHANTAIGHKVKIGDFVNISPLVSIIGPSKIGNFSFIGAGSVILPDVEIGSHVIIPAGSLVNRSLKNFETFDER